MPEKDTPREQEQSEIFNKEKVLDSISGDMELFKEIVELFLEFSQKQIADIHRAVHDGNSMALARAAHALKSSLGNFAAKDAYEMALKLEMIGRNEDLGQAKEACRELEEQISILKSALRDLKEIEVSPV